MSNEILNLKPSKFNYLQDMDDGSVVIYNYHYKQLCKFPKEIKDDVKYILKGNNSSSITNNIMLQKELVKRNLLVPIDRDENASSQLDFMNEITRKVIVLTIYPTMDCNFRCPYCYQNHDNKVMSSEIKDGIVKFVRKNISKFTGVVVGWFGGEPLKELESIKEISRQLINICHKRNRTYYASITTNGYYLNLETFNMLFYECNIKKFAITIDGLADIHDKQRYTKDGYGSFDTIINNLLEIKKISKNVNFEINIRSNVSVDGLNDLENYIKFMKFNFGDDNRFCFYFRPVYNWGGDTIEGFSSKLLTSRNEQSLIYHKIYDTNIALNLRQHYLDLMESVICYACREYGYTIETDGRIAKCTGESRGIKNYVGSINANGEMLLDNSIIGQWASKYTSSELCSKCFFESNCHSNFCLVGKMCYGSESKYCPSGKDFIHEFLRLLNKFNSEYQYIEEIAIKGDYNEEF